MESFVTKCHLTLINKYLNLKEISLSSLFEIINRSILQNNNFIIGDRVILKEGELKLNLSEIILTTFEENLGKDMADIESEVHELLKLLHYPKLKSIFL